MEKEFEKKLRTMRQELERVKANYESKAGKTPEAKQVKQLEEELQKTKDYYNKRIREIEDKYKYGMGKAKSKAADVPRSSRSGVPEVPKSNRSAVSDTKDIQDIKLENEILTKNNRLLAQKVADLEHNRNLQRKASFVSGADSARGSVRSGAGTPVKGQEARNTDLSNVFYGGAGSPDQHTSSPSPPKPPMDRPKTSNAQDQSLNPFDTFAL